MAREFGKRGAPQQKAAAPPATGESFLAGLSLPPIEPFQILQGALFFVLGVVLANIVIFTVLAPEPEFYQVVIKQPRLFDELPDGTTKEIFYTPKEQPKS